MQESLLEFPASVTVKAMGLSSETFATTVEALVVPHLRNDETHEIRSNQSSKGKYTSVSITFVARDQPHLEAVYSSLQACEEVVFTL